MASSPKEVAEKSDVVFSIVGYSCLCGSVMRSFPNDVREVTIGEKGILAGLHVGVFGHRNS